MSSSELTRLIKARHLPAAAVVVDADESERAALAKRFALDKVTSLHATVELEDGAKSVRASGEMKAAISQLCAVSGEPFDTIISEPIALRFVEESVVDLAVDENDEIEIELVADDCDEIIYAGEAFDLGEAIAQTLGLAIDPYAVGPQADAARKASGIVAEGEQDGPLAAALSALKKD